MANRRRGEVPLLLGGTRYILCLTLGALAELEEAFAVADLTALGERFAGGRLSARDLVAFLGAALRGGGHPLTDDEVAALPLEGGLAPLTEALGRVVEAAFGEEAPANPRIPRKGARPGGPFRGTRP